MANMLLELNSPVCNCTTCYYSLNVANILLFYFLAWKQNVSNLVLNLSILLAGFQHALARCKHTFTKIRFKIIIRINNNQELILQFVLTTDQLCGCTMESSMECSRSVKRTKEEKKLLRRQIKASHTLLKHEDITTVSHPTKVLMELILVYCHSEGFSPSVAEFK